MKFAISYSFGKDSALALWRMVRQGHAPVALLTTYNEKEGRSWFHGVERDLMSATAGSLGIPFLPCPCSGEDYQEQMRDTLRRARQMGAEACVFGDIDIEGHLEWNRRQCEAAGLACQMPLWREDRESVVRECIGEGFAITIKCVQNEYRDLLGRRLDEETLEDIRRSGADLCGENGEYHTFVHDGPTFKRPVPIAVGPPIDLGAHSVVDIRLRDESL